MITKLPLTCPHDWEHYVQVATGTIQRRQCRYCGSRESVAPPVIRPGSIQPGNGTGSTPSVEAPADVPAVV